MKKADYITYSELLRLSHMGKMRLCWVFIAFRESIIKSNLAEWSVLSLRGDFFRRMRFKLHKYPEIMKIRLKIWEECYVKISKL